MLENKILKTIKEYNLIEPEDIVLVAVSGGPDSMCLLNSLYNLKDKLKIKKIAIAHVNHMLRSEAEEETQYVKRFAELKNIDFFVKYVDIKKISENNKIGEEEAGRKERYKFFEEVAQKINANKIAIAHNYNDNAETVLMHLMRGAGISGLSGIKPFREEKYIRPIIKCSREEIEQYCEEKGLNPKYDESNKNNLYTRNRIRNQLIPFIKEKFNPNIIDTLNRVSSVVMEEENYIENVINNEYKNILKNRETNKIEIDVKKFNKLDKYIKSRMVLYIIKELFENTNGIEQIHIKDIIKLCENNIGNKYLTPNKNMKVFIKAGIVSFEKVLK